MFCDIDDFKRVHDTSGHIAGDEVIRVIAARMRAAVRAGDALARVGGDEFLIVVDGVHDLDEALAVAQKIRTAGEVHVAAGRVLVQASLSIGVTLMAVNENVDSMIARADAAMYEAKAAGKNQVVEIPAEV